MPSFRQIPHTEKQVYKFFDKKETLLRVLLDFLGSFFGCLNWHTGPKSSLDTKLVYEKVSCCYFFVSLKPSSRLVFETHNHTNPQIKQSYFYNSYATITCQGKSNLKKVFGGNRHFKMNYKLSKIKNASYKIFNCNS